MEYTKYVYRTHPESLHSVSDKSETNLFQFYQGENYLALPRDPQPWLIEKLVPSAGAMNVYGAPKLGKSYLALGVAIAVSDPSVQTWLGHNVLKHGPVTYLQVDTPRSEWAERIERIKKAGHKIDNIYFTDSNLVPYPLNINVHEIKAALKAKIAEQKSLLLVVDTLREVHEGDENDSGDMKRVITSLVETTREAGCGLLLVSHSRKGFGAADGFGKGGGGTGGGGDDYEDSSIMEDNRGSSYVAGRMDIIAKLTKQNLFLKGRSIGLTRVGVEQNEIGMIVHNRKKEGNELNIKCVLAMKELKSDRQRADMLAAMERIEPEAARTRIRDYKKKYGLLTKEKLDGKEEES